MGGPTGVRAYPVGDGSGDEGNKLTLEGRYLITRGSAFGDVQVSAFYDTAWLSQYQDASNLNLTTPNNYRISGGGFALQAVREGKSQVNLTWAQKMGSNPLANPVTGNDADGTNDDSRLWLSASLYF